MPLMPRRPNPLGDLLRARRRASKVGYKQLYDVTGLDRETLRKWETGDTYDVPLRGVLLYARAVGITLDELVDAASGVSVGAPRGESRAIADAARVLPARPRERRQSDPPPKQRHRSRP